MKTLNNSSIEALISLLEDPNEVVFNQIRESILALGFDGISYLQTAYDACNNKLQKERIVQILDKLKIEKLESDLESWKAFHQDDVLAALIKIAKYGHPNLNEKTIQQTISEIVEAVRSKINNNSTPEDIVHVLNQVILYDFRFNGNIRNYSGINNSFINKIIENKISNPIGLSVLYLLVAKELQIPLVGINSPGHFVVGYVAHKFTTKEIEDGTLINNILFYIDPFNNGKIISPNDYDKWLLQVPYKLENKKFLPATNKTIVQRVMNNLIYALFTTGEKTTAKELLEINDTLSVDE